MSALNEVVNSYIKFDRNENILRICSAWFWIVTAISFVGEYECVNIVLTCYPSSREWNCNISVFISSRPDANI